MTDYEVAVREDVAKAKSVEESPFDLFPLLNPDIVLYNDISRDILTRKLISVIEETKKNIIISVEFIETETEVFKSLKRKIELGIKCIILAKLDTKNKGFFNEISGYDNVSLYSFDENLMQYLISDNTNGIVYSSSLTAPNFEGGRNNSLCFGIKLDSRLLQNIQDFFNQSISIREGWKYEKEKTLSSIKGKQIIRESAEDVSVKSTESVQDYLEISVGSFTVDSLRDLKVGSFNGELTHEGLVKKVKYKYALQPKVRSSNFKKSDLYDQWSRERQKLVSYVNNLRVTAEGIGQKKSSFIEQFSISFKRLMLGKDIAIKQVIRNINELDEKIKLLNFNKEMYQELSVQVNEIYKDISKHEEEITVAIDKDKKEQEWIKQKQSLENEISQLIDDINKSNKDMDKISNESEEKKKGMHLKRSELQKTLNNIETKVYVFLDENKFLEEIVDKQERAEKLIRGIDVKVKDVKSAGKKHIKNRFEEAKSQFKKEVCVVMNDESYYDNKMIHIAKTDNPMDSVLNEMKQYVKENLLKDMLQHLDKKERELLKELDSQKAALTECENELKQLENNINVLTQKTESELKLIKGKTDKKETDLLRKKDNLEKMGSEFKYENNPTSGDEELKSIMKKGNKNNQQAINNKLNAFSYNLPSEDLPQAGTLYQQGNNRQLAVIYWSELDVGEKEALRLNAELVCEREA